MKQGLDVENVRIVRIVWCNRESKEKCVNVLRSLWRREEYIQII